MSKLKNCPFCGGAAEILNIETESCEVNCMKCGASYYFTLTAHVVNEAIKAWNTRAEDNKQ